MSRQSQHFPLDQHLLNAFELEKEEIHQMKEQNRILTSMNEKVTRRDQEIEQLTHLVSKYKKHYDEYEYMKALLSHKNKECERATQENKILFSEMNKIVAENKELQEKLLNAEKLKHEFIRERNASDNRFRGIEETFREYQDECKNKEKELLQSLERSQREIKCKIFDSIELNIRISDLTTFKFENEQLKARITNLNSIRSKNLEPNNDDVSNSENRENYLESMNRSQNISTFGNGALKPNFSQHLSNNKSKTLSKSRERSVNRTNPNMNGNGNEIEALLAENERLKKELVNKENELQRSKVLNHQLSVEFDKSVNTNCEFEKELSHYRRENHELKKTLSLFVEKDQYDKMHKGKIREGSEGSEEEEDESDYFGGYSHSER